MSVSSPLEPVYYYECSNGTFRLLYFIPPEVLEFLIGQRKIDPRVLEEFPDGVDLNCMEPDFAEFEREYGFRPRFDPAALRRAFFTLFSDTHDWENFRGSGMIPAAEIEQLVEPIEIRLDVGAATLEDFQPTRSRSFNVGHIPIMSEKLENILKNVKVESIKANRTLKQQTFEPIKMEAGKPAEDVFLSLHRKSRER